jgi:hypothetical protein
MCPSESKTRRGVPADDLRSAEGRSAQGQSAERASAAPAVQQCRAWIDWAATQVEVCLAGDSAASEQLVAALDAMLRSARRRSAATADLAASDTIEQKTAAAVIAIQSHDRLVQQLTHVADALRALHEQLGDERRTESVEAWYDLREKQLRAFSMTEERVLFAHMVAGGAGREHAIAVNSDDDVEMF